MDVEKRIVKFNQECKPFYIVKHNAGNYSLCLQFSFLSGEYKNFGQQAFNEYARRNNEPITERDLYTHGSGYEWDAVFKKAFEDDPKLECINFDSEAGSFFCNCNDLSVLEDLGSRFRTMCMDEGQFKELVCDALTELYESEEPVSHEGMMY